MASPLYFVLGWNLVYFSPHMEHFLLIIHASLINLYLILNKYPDMRVHSSFSIFVSIVHLAEYSIVELIVVLLVFF